MMTDIKRHYEDLLEGSASPSNEISADGKRSVKPGRKPIESEPKSKRTAQNRAAQRAYRERKEKKMKDLEDKVKSLEDENSKINTETDLLRAQINLLKSELVKYKGSGVELNLPTTVGKLSHPVSSNSLNSKASSDFSDSRSSASSLNDSSPDTDVSDTLLKSEFPWSKNNLQLGYYRADDNSGKNIFMDNDTTNNVPDLISGSSSSTSPLNDNILLDNNSKFDEQMDPFCEKLNESCVTKECLLERGEEKKNSVSNTSFKNTTTPSPFGFYNNEQIFNDTFNFNLTPNDDNDPLSFLNDNNFDVNLAFEDNAEKYNPIESLVTEESVYDPLKDDTNTDFNFNEFIQSSVPSVSTSADNLNSSKGSVDADNDDEVVPAPEKTFRCSEIWDRITSHPRYTEIDIDGLCSELKTKAKCSERGVVVNASDVNAILEQSAKQR